MAENVDLSVIKLAQYLSGLTTSQDLWRETGKALTSFLGTDMVVFARLDRAGAVELHHWIWTGLEWDSAENDPVPPGFEEEQVRKRLEAAVLEALDTGFFTTCSLSSPQPYGFMVFPLAVDNCVDDVMLVGLQSEDQAPNTLFNLYLAVSRLVGTTAERLATESELRDYRQRLETLVQERTAELTRANERLQQEITERILAEAELVRAKEAAQAANKAKGEFLANMSHEIRTPLNAVIGLTDMTLTTSLTPKQQDYLDKISSSARSLLGLINDIMDFSKIDANKLEIENVAFSLERILEDLLNLAGMKAAEKNLEFLYDIDPDVPPELLGDPLRLRQILVNLAVNAVKFTPAGAVVLGVRRASVVQAPDSGDDQSLNLLFFVKDTGIGMTEQQVQGLFTPFHQADASTTRKYGGTGLGLAICKSLVDMMQGSIWVESSPDAGSTFFCSLPFKISQAQPPAPVGPAPLQQALLADANPLAREVLRRTLQQANLDVLEASSLPEALEILAGPETPDLLLVDWSTLKAERGALAQLRHALQRHRVPVLLVAPTNRTADARDAVEQAGLSGVLGKTLTPWQLAKNLAEATQSGQAASNLEGGEQQQRRRRLCRLKGASVLLVEDNELNRMVALEHLQHLGIEADVAVNGLEAVDKTSARHYDLVLMDIQMPEMDGYEATRAIRRRESQQGGKRQIISAMTAHALNQEVTRCTEAGMDGYISKPFETDQFHDLLLELIPARSTPEPGAAPSCAPESECSKTLPQELPGLDVAKALAMLGGCKELYTSLLLRFAEEYATTGLDIMDALESGDMEHAGRLAHTIKGLAGNIGAETLRQVAREIEEDTRNDNTERPLRRMGELQLAMAEVQEAAAVCREMLEKNGVV